MAVFIGRERELAALTGELNDWTHRSAVLVYGKRRVGKSTLIRRAAESFQGIVVSHMCVSSTYRGNLELLCQSVSDALGLQGLRFDSLQGLMTFLGTDEQRFLVILDEYPYLRETGRRGDVDSILQAVIDRLPGNVKLILCGSYVSMMRELLEEDNPLFGRFSLIQHIRDFDYYDASKFYPALPPRQKIAFYAVFGGSPYVLEHLESERPLRENLLRLLLPETGLVRTHVEYIMLREIRKAYDVRILEALGNGKKRYSEIRGHLQLPETGLLDKQIKILLDMETIRKTAPINRRSDKKKQFYEIEDNLTRFYFAFLFGKNGTLSRIGDVQFFRRNIEPQLEQFISRRLEGVALEYFHRLAVAGGLPEVEDFGSYWYDDPVTKTNGEYDCVLVREGEQYDFYECKYFDRPMTIEECIREEAQLRGVRGIQVSDIGFVCTGGFASPESDRYRLVGGEDLYDGKLKYGSV